MSASRFKPTGANAARQGRRTNCDGWQWAPPRIVPLENGHSLAVHEYGEPQGQPVIFCHGWPSSSTMAELTDVPAKELGLRIISPDRPGISGSSLHRERRLLDWVPIVRQVADHLGLAAFRVLAISGGAPYALATAFAMPDRVPAIAVISGAPSLTDLSDHTGLLPLYRWMLLLYHRNPSLLRFFFRLARPFASLRMSIRLARKMLRFLQPCDAEALRDAAAFNACFESQRRAWRGGAEGVMLDAEIYAQPWGFRLEEISTPVRLWHGRKDRSFSYRLAEEMAKRLPNCQLRIVEDAGHYSLPIRNMREILADLIEA